MPSCPQCPGRYFTSKEDLDKHQMFSSTWHPYCHKCQRLFVHEKAYASHTAAKHPPTYDCETCNRTYRSQAALEEHYRGSPVHPNCQRCRKGFKDDGACENHHASDHPQIRCLPCGGRSIYAEELEQHHLDSPNHPCCAHCSRGFEDDLSYNEHAASAHPEMRCQPCERQFESLEALSKHYRFSPKHAKCLACDCGFKDEGAYLDHILSTHGARRNADVQRVSPPAKSADIIAEDGIVDDNLAPHLPELDLAQSQILQPEDSPPPNDCSPPPKSGSIWDSDDSPTPTPASLQPAVWSGTQVWSLHPNATVPAIMLTSPLETFDNMTLKAPLDLSAPSSPPQNEHVEPLICDDIAGRGGPMVGGPLSDSALKSPLSAGTSGHGSDSPATHESSCFDPTNQSLSSEFGDNSTHLPPPPPENTIPYSDWWQHAPGGEHLQPATKPPLSSRLIGSCAISSIKCESLEFHSELSSPRLSISPSVSPPDGLTPLPTVSPLELTPIDLPGSHYPSIPSAEPMADELRTPSSLASSSPRSFTTSPQYSHEYPYVESILAEKFPLPISPRTPPVHSGHARSPTRSWDGVAHEENDSRDTEPPLSSESELTPEAEPLSMEESFMVEEPHQPDEKVSPVLESSPTIRSGTMSQQLLHCRICRQEPCVDLTATMCGHIFCYRCISEAVIMSSRCPVCATPTLLYCLFRIDLTA